MLQFQDALENDSSAIEEYPHHDFAVYFSKRIKSLYDGKKWTPFNIARIPFEMAEEMGGLPKERKREYGECVKNLKVKSNEKISTLCEKESGKRLPKLDVEKWTKGLESEFAYAYSVAHFAQLCESQKKDEQTILLCFLNLIDTNAIDFLQLEKEPLKKLKGELQKPFSEENSIQFFEDCLCFFSPYYLMKEEMNEYFKRSICSCVVEREKPHLPFFKKLWLLGRLNKIHCYPVTFGEVTSESELPEPLSSKIRALKTSLQHDPVKFPEINVGDDWGRRKLFFGFKMAIPALLPIFRSLPHLENECKTKALDKKIVLEKARTNYSFLDWVEFPLDKLKDEKHRLFAFCMGCILTYSQKADFWNSHFKENPQRILEYVESLKKAIHSEAEKKIMDFEWNKVNLDGNFSEILVLFGLVERLLYPDGILSGCQKISDRFGIVKGKYLSREENKEEFVFRFYSILGDICRHSKIVKFITIPDFERNIQWLNQLNDLFSSWQPAFQKIESELQKMEKLTRF